MFIYSFISKTPDQPPMVAPAATGNIYKDDEDIGKDEQDNGNDTINFKNAHFHALFKYQRFDL